MFQDEELDTGKLEQELAKNVGEEETPSEETSTEETPPEEKSSEEKPSEEETHEDTTSLKSEEKPIEEEEIDGLPKEYHKDPRWQKLKQDRDTAVERAKVADDLEGRLGDLSLDELEKLKTAGGLLRKYPDLAKKVQTVIDGHTYGNEETKGEIDSTKQDIQNLRHEMVLDKYDSAVDRLVSQHKVDKDVEPLLREVLDNRVMKAHINDAKEISPIFEKALKDVNLAYRKKLASHIVDKSKERKVPASPTQRGKVIVTKSEATDVQSRVDELTEGLKAHRGEPIKE